jgi:hypothetical protein
MIFRSELLMTFSPSNISNIRFIWDLDRTLLTSSPKTLLSIADIGYEIGQVRNINI